MSVRRRGHGRRGRIGGILARLRPPGWQHNLRIKFLIRRNGCPVFLDRFHRPADCCHRLSAKTYAPIRHRPPRLPTTQLNRNRRAESSRFSGIHQCDKGMFLRLPVSCKAERVVPGLIDADSPGINPRHEKNSRTGGSSPCDESLLLIRAAPVELPDFNPNLPQLSANTSRCSRLAWGSSRVARITYPAKGSRSKLIRKNMRSITLTIAIL